VLALSRTQLEIMLLLREHDSQTTTQLAKQLFLTPGAVTQTIETLVQRELIERLPDNNDRRLIHLRLSPAGTEAINRVIQQRRKRMKALLTQLSPPELEALIIGAERLAQLIEQDTDTNESPA
jgi:DNA-binding MarR family transcriptional regulator